MIRSARPRVAVVIPTLNEATTIVACLGDLATQGPDEVVVCDAESPDGTAELAEAAGARVLRTPRGRGQQQNQGARATTAELLLFLHADCRLEPGALDCLRSFAARNPAVPGGCFRMRVEADGLGYRTIDAAAHLRAGVLGLPYGDQAIFARRAAFERVGGIPELPLMDDLYFALRLRRLGRLALLSRQVVVSARRWRQAGLVRQSLRNWTLTALAAGGVSPRHLHRFYPVIR